jgi:hypothetical protein
MLIHKIPVVKAKLDVIPERERVLFVLLGHFLAVSYPVEQYFGKDLRELNAEEIDIGEPVSLETITLPYFTCRATREAKNV